MNWTGKKILVTGADGFIGSHLTETLVKSGADVTALSLYNSFGHTGWLEDMSGDVRADCRIVRGDVRDPHQMLDLCAGQEFVFHLAALISIPYSYEAVSHYLDTNVLGTTNVLQGSLKGGVSRIVHTSTSEVYGTAQTLPINEDHPLHAQSPYAASKIGGDKIAESYFCSFEAPVTTLRPFNTFGPRQSERAVISSLIRQALDPNSTEIAIGDRTPRRDFMYVADTVAAFMALAAAESVVEGNVYNAGSGGIVTIGDVLDRIVELTGSTLPVREAADRMRPANSEVFALQADYSRLEKATGWQPAMSLEAGLEENIDWWRANIGKARQSLNYLY